MRPLAAFLALAALGCTSSSRTTPSGASGTCESQGYLTPPSQGGCPKGTCLATDTSASCCGSQCATCEDKGLISMIDGGTCPPGTVVSSDLTEALRCCDSEDAEPEGTDAAPESSSDAGSDGSTDAADAGD
jgi:hypothetical protein